MALEVVAARLALGKLIPSPKIVVVPFIGYDLGVIYMSTGDGCCFRRLADDVDGSVWERLGAPLALWP